jgi:hypothetical protein
LRFAAAFIGKSVKRSPPAKAGVLARIAENERCIHSPQTCAAQQLLDAAASKSQA